MIRHDPFLELAAIAIDFELSAAERTRLEAHLATCPVCLRAASALHADARSLAALPPVRLAERRADQLLAGVLATPRAALGSLRLLAVAALLVVLAVGGILVGAELLRRASDDDPLVVVPSPSGSVAPSNLPAWVAAAVPAREADGRWEIRTQGVAIGDGAMVAFGRWDCRDDETDCRLELLTSADGTAWAPVPAQASMATEVVLMTSGPEIGIVDVTWGPAGWVAIGRVADPQLSFVLWTSDDGVTWDRQAVDPIFDDADPKAIAATDDGYIVVGTDYGTMKLDGETWAVAWTSPDGRIWTRTERTAALGTGAFCDTTEWPGYGGMDGVVALPDGGFLAVGMLVTEAAGPGEQCPWSAQAWRSADGVSWQRVAGFPALQTYGIDIAADGWRMAAVTACPDAGCSMVMTSIDGTTWSSRPGPQDAIVSDIAVDGEDVVVVGPNGIGRLGSRVWRLTTGGPDWAADELPGVAVGNVRVVAIDARGGVESIVGWAEAYAEGDPPSFAFARR